MNTELIAQIINACMSNESGKSHSYEVGQCYLIRATYHHIGKLVAVTDTDLLLEGGGWLADSGRFGECLASGTVSEIEVMPSGMRRMVSRADVIDAFPWNHPLPTETK